MSGINLVPSERLQRRAAERRFVAWGRAIAIVVLVLVLAHLGVRKLASDADGRVAALRQRYALLTEDIRLAENLIKERDRLLRRKAAIAEISSEPRATEFLETTGHALTPQAHLSLLQLARERDAVEAALTGDATLVVRGVAPDIGEVGLILRQMRMATLFSDVTFIGSGERGRGGRDGIAFELACRSEREIP